jgi:hypothetical protein
MRRSANRLARGVSITRSVSIAVVLAGALASAAAAAAPSKWAAPRTADGRPDLSGVWSNASVTKLTRPPGMEKLVVSEAEAGALAKANPAERNLEADAAPTDANDPAPSAGDVGGYNAFWLDPGRTLAAVKGEFRTSWIVEPADGQLPFSDSGRQLVGQARAFARQADVPAGPEALEPWDRCLISSRGSGGPGMLNNIYNSNYQIVQTPGSVAIVVEMIHDVRTIPLFPDKAAAQAGHGPAALHPWLGDSVGWWEGDTLVIETVNVNPEQGRAGPIFLSPQAQVTERFTRASERQIFYAFQVEDPVYYSRTWRAEMSLNASKDQIYEYACHEGNYAMSGILAGARAQEGAKASGKAGSGGEK